MYYFIACIEPHIKRPGITTLDYYIEFLDCSCSEVQKVLASECDRLREIRCLFCHELREITLSNESQLIKIEFSSDHKIKENPWNYVQKTIQQNNGEIEIWTP